MTLRDIRYRSSAWRRAQRTLRKKVCVSCGSASSRVELHHIHYAETVDISHAQTMTLCSQCHVMIHTLSRQLGLNIEQIDAAQARALTLEVVHDRARQLPLALP